MKLVVSLGSFMHLLQGLAPEKMKEPFFFPPTEQSNTLGKQKFRLIIWVTFQDCSPFCHTSEPQWKFRFILGFLSQSRIL